MTIDLRVPFNVPFTFQSEGKAAWWWIGTNEAEIFQKMTNGKINIPNGDVFAWISIAF